MQAVVAAATAAVVTAVLWQRRASAPLPPGGRSDEADESKEGPRGVLRRSVERITTYFPGREARPNPIKLRSWPIAKSLLNTNETVILPPPMRNLHRDQLRLRPRTCEFVRAGPREVVYWKSGEVRAAIVTCGGLCPGLNTVIRELVCCLHFSYQVKSVFGVQGGYKGFYTQPLLPLTPSTVKEVHLEGGTFLGSSRGGFELEKILDCIETNKLNQVYIIGGDGTHRGAKALAKGAREAGLEVAFACVPKTIDNDVPLIDKSFGFDTAVEQAVRVINSATVEAEAHPRGLGVVKLMGRHAGFIAMTACLAARQANVCLIPEMSFRCERVCEYINTRLDKAGDCVLVIAEGTEMCDSDRAAVTSAEESQAVDASGNKKMEDVGVMMVQYIQNWFDERSTPINIKYLDPTYIIRSVPANPSDSILCAELAYNAVHGVMAGFTTFTVGKINNVQVMLPVELVASQPSRQVDTRSRRFVALMLNTGQPDLR